MSQPEIRIYSTRVCGYCTRAKQLLQRKGAEYTEFLIDAEPERRREMEELSGRRTVPQIFIGERHIGGFDELYALDRSGELNAILGIDQD